MEEVVEAINHLAVVIAFGNLGIIIVIAGIVILGKGKP